MTSFQIPYYIQACGGQLRHAGPGRRLHADRLRSRRAGGGPGGAAALHARRQRDEEHRGHVLAQGWGVTELL